jgi:hypothetical protein
MRWPEFLRSLKDGALFQDDLDRFHAADVAPAQPMPHPGGPLNCQNNRLVDGRCLSGPRMISRIHVAAQQMLVKP